MIKKKDHSNTIPNQFILFFFLFSWFFLAMIKAQNTTIPVNVGVVLDFDSGSGKTAKVYLSCIEMALLDIYASHPYFKTRLVLNTRNSKQTVAGAAAAALDLIKNAEVLAILGPETSMQASFVVNLGDKAHVPILSFSASTPYLTSQRSPYFFRITQTDSYQVKAISGIVQTFGWRQVVPVYVDNMYGEGIIPFLIDALQEVDVHVPYRGVISPSATGDQIEKELYKLMTMQTRVFIVHMMPNLCSQLFAKAKEIGMMSEGYVWILTDGISNRLNLMNSSVMNSMEGVLGIQTYIPRTTELEKFKLRWKGKFQQDNPTIIDAKLDVYALQAYDAAFALAMAVENAGMSTGSKFHDNASFNSAELDTYKVSQNGPKLAEALLFTRFKGIAGDFKLVEGQLQSSTLTIVNVNSEGEKPVAFWTPENRMVEKLNDSINTGIPSTSSSCNLGTIKWPGNSLSVPRGWEIPSNGKKLKIGVPVKSDFTEFIKITKDPNNGTIDVTGFCIDVFNAALEVLPYSIPYELTPFANPDGTSAGNYNDLVYQVYLGKFDAVVGDTTIRANRSLYVDFTMPYTESGLVMVVPIKDTRSKNAWVFLKPFTWDLWLTTSCFFLFTAFVVWILEHQNNQEFRGPLLHQFRTSVWFCFSMMMFASNRQKVVSNLARLVIAIWLFVVLILTQTYTANLISQLTVQQLKPTVADIKDLLRKGDYVGYSKNAYVYGLLKEVGFNDSKLKGFRTVETLDEALSKGSANGGIAAFVHETASMKLFVANYCSKYTMITIFKTEGFGFVFPKHSPLLPDVSQAILNVTEGEKMMSIESKWFKKEGNCQSSSQLVSSNSLASFWGLFLIAGVSSIFALIINVALFFTENGHLLMDVHDSEASIWERIRVMFKIFDDKDLNSHTFRSSQPRDRFLDARDELYVSPNNNWPENPFSSTLTFSRPFEVYEEPRDCIPDARDEVNVSPNYNWPENPFSYAYSGRLEGYKIFENLTSINFESCQFLKEIPHISGLPNLRILNLDCCTNLVKIDDSVGFIEKLVDLSLSGCHNLIIFPRRIALKSVEHINIRDCRRLETFPEIVGEMKSLTWLDLSGTAIEELPSSIGYLINLEELIMKECENLTHLPSCIYELQHLWCLDLQYCSKLVMLPMWNAESLPTISPDLWYLNLRGCKRLREIPQLPPKVQWLNAADCVQLESFATLSNILEHKESEMIKCLVLSNCERLCDKLAHDVAKIGRNILTEVSLCSLFLSCTQSEFEVVFPANEIPKWFSHHKHLNFLETSKFSFEIPLGLKLGDKGLAICAAVAVETTTPKENDVMQSNLGSCTFTAKIDINGESTIARSFSFEARDVASAHVWLCYIPFIMFAYHQSPPFTCGVSVEHTSRGSVRCKSYGVHLVIPQDEHEDAW